MIAAPHWFGHAAQCFGMVHWPEGGVRGGVVICPPLGYEAVCSHRALRLLAEGLAREGLACVRLDYPGMGNSLTEPESSQVVAAWEATVQQAIAELRSFGVGHVTVVGLRYGALLAAMASRAGPIDAMVLWDPIVSGKRYVRALRVLGTTSASADHAGGVAVGGVWFAPEVLSSISTSAISTLPSGVRCLRVHRREGPVEDVPVDERHAAGRVDVPGMGALLDTDAELAEVPTEAMAVIVSWIGESAPLTGTELKCPVLRSETTERRDEQLLRHRALRIGRSGLFAVETVVEGTRPSQAVVFLNNGVASNIGPGRRWVEWAAGFAAGAAVSLRLDLSGLGDSPARPGSPECVSYPVAAADDLAEAVGHLRARGVTAVATIGLCSGAVLAFDGALRCPELEHIVAINPRFDVPFHDRRQRRVRAGGQTNRLLAVPLSKAPLLHTFGTVPAAVWRLLAMSRLVPSPATALRRVLAGGTNVMLVFGPAEWGLIALRRRDPRRWRELRQRPNLVVAEIAELDHSMFDLDAMASVGSTVRAYISEHFLNDVPPASTTPHENERKAFA